MKRAKDIAFITFLCFSLLVLALLVVISSAAHLYGDSASGEETLSAFASDLADGGAMLFVYSVAVGLSFLIFDIKPLPAFWKRALHVVLNYALMTAFFVLLTAGRSGRGAMMLLLTFIFIAVYIAGALICRGLAKLEALKPKKTKKSEKN